MLAHEPSAGLHGGRAPAADNLAVGRDKSRALDGYEITTWWELRGGGSRHAARSSRVPLHPAIVSPNPFPRCHTHNVH